MREFGIVNSVKNFYVGFSDETTIPILKLLKRGFRHCFIFFGDEYNTFVLDPISNRIDLSFLPIGVEKIAEKLKQSGIIIVFVNRFENKKISTSGVFTCVEVVKRVLGISKLSIITPFRLYKFLKK
ncbi:MAG: hypothetical protein K6F04_04055 [bacterium]|nr:hypothetical protein [bacterium]